MKNLLPLGSIVLLENGIKKIMVFGRLQVNEVNGQVYDCAGCFYPEGLLKNEKIFLFNDEDINTLVFKGFENEEESEIQLLFENYFSDLEKGEMKDE